MRYRLKKKLVPLGAEEAIGEGDALVEVMNKAEYWKRFHSRYQDHLLIRNLERAQYCRADLLKDCVIGTFVIPVKDNLLKGPVVFGYYMDKTHLIFIDDSGEAAKVIREIEKVQIFDKISVSHLLFELMEYLVRDETEFLQKYEERMTDMEEEVVSGRRDQVDVPAVIIRARKELAKLSTYYSQLMNMSQTLTENYNGLLNDDERALFHLLSGRMARLVDYGKELREYALQIREMHQARLDMKQNHVLSLLTVVTTIFMPLTLIVGWYGMNFKYMPELNWRYGYGVCLAVSVIIVLAEVWYFKRNGWLKK